MDRIEDRACKLAIAMAELKNKNSYHSYKDTMVSIYKPVEKMVKPFTRLERISQEWLGRLGEMKKSKELDVARLKRYFYGTSVYSLAFTISNIMFNENDDTVMIADFIKFIYNLDTEDKFNMFMTYYYRYYARSNTSSNLIEQRDTAKDKHGFIEIMFSDKYNREAVDNIYKHCITNSDTGTLITSIADSNMRKPKKAKIPVIIKPDLDKFDRNEILMSEIDNMVIGHVNYFLEEIVSGKPTLKASGIELTGEYGKGKLEGYINRANKKDYALHPVFIDDDTLSHPFVSLNIFKNLKTKVVFILKIIKE